jgi:cold shock CspA family protein/ribosome-associated translation inhibitor RaiA
MQRALQITARDFLLTGAMEAQIRDKAQALDSYYDRLTGCHVVVEAPVRHHRKGGPFTVRIDLKVPRGELTVTRQHGEDLSVAIRDAFDAARRRLEDYAREIRGDVKSREGPAVARVARMYANEGYGFLETADGREIYFHCNSVLDGRFGDLTTGTRVRFVEEMGERGAQASTVAILGGQRKR